MITAHKSILLSSMHVGPSDANGGIWNLTPWTDFTCADELTFVIDVQQIFGSPTAGSLFAKFQLGISHKTGVQWGSNRLFDLEPAQKTTLITEGDWPSPLATYTMPSPTSRKRTIRDFGSMCNLQLDASSLTGGSNPSFGVTVTLIQKGR
jgi:hypothetical protein